MFADKNNIHLCVVYLYGMKRIRSLKFPRRRVVSISCYLLAMAR